jgi:NADPH:quinone reductase-like Zn-dependent oxidoreductase
MEGQRLRVNSVTARLIVVHRVQTGLSRTNGLYSVDERPTILLMSPQNVAKHPAVKVVSVFSKFERKTLEFMVEAMRDGKLVIPISRKLPLSEAAGAQAAAEKGGIEKILLIP